MFAPAKASIAKIGAVGHPFDARYAMAHARRVALAADSPSKTLAIPGWDKATQSVPDWIWAWHWVR